MILFNLMMIEKVGENVLSFNYRASISEKLEMVNLNIKCDKETVSCRIFIIHV